MAAEPSATTSTMTAAGATEKVAVAADSADADPVRWEFRLTADRRRILVPVNRSPRPGVAASTPLSWAL